MSFVILDFGAGSPVAVFLPDPGIRRLITGFLFGSKSPVALRAKLAELNLQEQDIADATAWVRRSARKTKK